MTFRILMGIDHYPPILGGSQLQTQSLCRQLTKRSHEVTVVTTMQSGFAAEEKDLAVDVRRIHGLSTRVPWFFKDHSQRRPPPFPDPGMVWQLRQLIENTKPDVVQACGWIAYSVAAALVGKRIPLIITVRNYFYSCAIGILMQKGQICDGPAIVKCLECATQYFGRPKAFSAVTGVYGSRDLLIREATVFHCISNYIEKILLRDLFSYKEKNQQYNDSDACCVLIPDLFAEPDNDKPDSAYLERLPAEPFILFVGALINYKGFNVLLEAYDRLVTPPPLVLIGTVDHNTPKLFPPGIIVIKDVPHRTVMAAWERCLFGVVPSLCPDSFPNVVLEGMSRAKPIIGTDAGGIPDMIVDGITGLLVPISDVGALTNAMQKLIDNRALCESNGQSGRERLEKMFTADTIVPRFENLYQELIDKNKNYT